MSQKRKHAALVPNDADALRDGLAAEWAAFAPGLGLTPLGVRAQVPTRALPRAALPPGVRAALAGRAAQAWAGGPERREDALAACLASVASLVRGCLAAPAPPGVPPEGPLGALVRQRWTLATLPCHTISLLCLPNDLSDAEMLTCAVVELRRAETPLPVPRYCVCLCGEAVDVYCMDPTNAAPLARTGQVALGTQKQGEWVEGVVEVASAFFSLLLESYAVLLSNMNGAPSSGALDRELFECALSLLREARTVLAEMDEENAYLAERSGTQATKLLDESLRTFKTIASALVHATS